MSKSPLANRRPHYDSGLRLDKLTLKFLNKCHPIFRRLPPASKLTSNKFTLILIGWSPPAWMGDWTNRRQKWQGINLLRISKSSRFSKLDFKKVATKEKDKQSCLRSTITKACWLGNWQRVYSKSLNKLICKRSKKKKHLRQSTRITGSNVSRPQQGLIIDITFKNLLKQLKTSGAWIY